MNELKEYYETQIDRKDKIIKTQTDEIYRLNELTEQLKQQLDQTKARAYSSVPDYNQNGHNYNAANNGSEGRHFEGNYQS